MNYQIARYSKGQIKIQEMAFVLMGIMIFFGIVVLIYLSMTLSGIRGEAQRLSDDNAKSTIKKISGIAEFYWGSCDNCIDLDKVLIMKERKEYEKFWDFDYLAVVRVYPNLSNAECNRGNYPNCGKITVVNGSVGSPAYTYVNLCRQEQEDGGFVKCELGKVYVSGRAIE